MAFWTQRRISILVGVIVAISIYLDRAYGFPPEPWRTVLLFAFPAVFILLGIYLISSPKIPVDLKGEIRKSNTQFMLVMGLLALLLGINYWFGTENFYELFEQLL